MPLGQVFLLSIYWNASAVLFLKLTNDSWNSTLRNKVLTTLTPIKLIRTSNPLVCTVRITWKEKKLEQVFEEDLLWSACHFDPVQRRYHINIPYNKHLGDLPSYLTWGRCLHREVQKKMAIIPDTSAQLDHVFQKNLNNRTLSYSRVLFHWPISRS